jgi:uncharacterized protein
MTLTSFEDSTHVADLSLWPNEWRNTAANVIANFELDIEGIHGIGHWTRVLTNGLRLAERNGANTLVIVAFALFHDCRRENDGYDPEHGFRGAEYGRHLRQMMPALSAREFDLFHEAATYHSDGLVDGDLTVQTCWDADRLDLYRVGILPSPNRLCTEAARNPDILDWAIKRSRWQNEDI